MMNYQSPGRSPDTPPSSSGAATPPNGSSASPSLSSSVIGSMWTGLMRRFSDIPDQSNYYGHDSQLTSSSYSQTFPNTRPAKDGIHGVFVPDVRRIASPFRPPPLDPIILHGFKDSTPQSARLLTAAVAEEIRIMLPERLRICEDWNLAYSLEQDGASLSTLYKRASAYQGRRVGFVLVVRDEAGGTFGAYLSEYPHPAPTYFGNGECFLWRASLLASLPPPPSADTTNIGRSTTITSPTSPSFPSSNGHSRANSTLEQRFQPPPSPEHSVRFKAFPYSGVNEYYINCETGFLSVGAGDGHYGLWLDDSLDRGHSGRSQTFGNEPLSDEGEKFGVLGVELWVLG